MHKFRTDKDFAIIFFFFFEKPKNLCTFQKSVFKEFLGNLKKYFFPPLGTMCIVQVNVTGKCYLGNSFSIMKLATEGATTHYGRSIKIYRLEIPNFTKKECCKRYSVKILTNFQFRTLFRSNSFQWLLGKLLSISVHWKNTVIACRPEWSF